MIANYSVTKLAETSLDRSADELPSAVDVDFSRGHGDVTLSELTSGERNALLEQNLNEIWVRVHDRTYELGDEVPLTHELDEAVNEYGGRAAFASSITDLLRGHMHALARTLLRLDTSPTTDGRDLDEVMVNEGVKLFISPHIGPAFSTPLHLAFLGERVTLPMFRDQGFAPLVALARIAASVSFPSASRLRIVPTPNLMGARLQESALRSGHSIIWPPDTVVGSTAMRNSVDFPLLGLERRVSIFPYLMAQKYRLPVFLAYSRMDEADLVSFHYERLDPPMENAIAFFAHVQAVVHRSVVANIDQWSQIRYFPAV